MVLTGIAITAAALALLLFRAVVQEMTSQLGRWDEIDFAWRPTLDLPMAPKTEAKFGRTLKREAYAAHGSVRRDCDCPFKSRCAVENKRHINAHQLSPPAQQQRIHRPRRRRKNT